MRERSTTRIPSRGFTLSRLTMHACPRKRFPLRAEIRMRIYPVLALTCLVACTVYADPVSSNQNAQVILEKVLTNRPVRDFSLKARLFVGDADPVMVEIFGKNTPTETRTIYRGGQPRALVVQPVNGEPHFYLRGVGELVGARRTEKLLGSEFSYYDLALPF